MSKKRQFRFLGASAKIPQREPVTGAEISAINRAVINSHEKQVGEEEKNCQQAKEKFEGKDAGVLLIGS